MLDKLYVLGQVDKAIAIIGRAPKIKMEVWQSGKGKIFLSEAELYRSCHNCGTAACFAGYIAVSPEFKAQGGYAGCSGIPTLNRPKLQGTGAIFHWLGFPNASEKQDYTLVDEWTPFYKFLMQMVHGRKLPGDLCTFYGKAWSSVDKHDVLEKLHTLHHMVESYTG